MKPTLPEHVKMYICTSCHHPYPDQPVTSCDCMPKQNDFREEIMLPAETVQRLIDEAYAAGLEDAKSGLKLSDFEPGKMYESTTHGTVTYKWIDSYMGQHTLEFYSPQYQQKLYVLPENMKRHFKMAKDGT